MFDLADIWARRTGEEVRLVSANDHVHSRKSAHYEGRAIDLHSSANAALARVLRGAGYAVLWNVPGHFGQPHRIKKGNEIGCRFKLVLKMKAILNNETKNI